MSVCWAVVVMREGVLVVGLYWVRITMMMMMMIVVVLGQEMYMHMENSFELGHLVSLLDPYLTGGGSQNMAGWISLTG